MPFDAMNDTSDEALLILYGNGDSSAARALALRLTPKILGIAMRMLGGDRAEAEDVAQDAMLKLWKQAGEWRQGEAKVTTWLYRVVSNLCIDRRRKMRSSSIDEIDEPMDEAPSAMAAIQNKARLNALDEALQTLPDRQREAMVLRHIEGLANPEIAEIMEIGVEAVESLTARGKRALKTALEARKNELGYEDDEPNA